jgi:cellulose synthase/poly-beta-1,6-N-acetylglucosamine synthase-like glycosyltransferase
MLDNLAVLLFWLSVGLLVYTYVLYPLLLAGLVRLRRPGAVEAGGASDLPFVSIVVAARDEEAIISHKLANCQEIDYPADRIEFLFGSDGSCDRTADLIRKQAGANVRSWAFPQQRGKAAVLNDLIPQARGSLVVFSDANSLFEPEAVRRLVRHFANPRVGGVCGRLALQPPGRARPNTGANESLYWRYESFLKNLEGRLGILASANGAIYAVRRSLVRPLPTDRPIADDLVIASGVLRQGFAMTFEPEAVAHETTPDNLRDDLQRKVRVGEISYNALPWIAPLLWPGRGLAALMLWSHKIIRWGGPLWLFLALGASVWLAASTRETFYGFSLAAQASAYAAAVAGFFLEPRGMMPRWLTFPYYFAGVHLALMLGLLRSLTRRGNATWKRVGR